MPTCFSVPFAGMNGINRVNGGVLVAISFNMQLEAGMAGLMTQTRKIRGFVLVVGSGGAQTTMATALVICRLRRH